MENDVVRKDSENTQRKTWNAAEAAAFPALGIRPVNVASPSVPAPSTAPEGLSRVPRSSVSPPISETVVTPAPAFAKSAAPSVPAGPAEDLDGIVELSSTMLQDAGDTGLHKIEMLADDLVEEVHDDELVEEVHDDLVEEVHADDLVEEVHDDIPELSQAEFIEEVDSETELIEEVDSGLLAYVETRGEISEKHHAVPAPVEVPKVSLASLHQNLHNQAIASGMLSYSTGVPIHDLESGTSASKTLQIHRPATSFNKLTKNVLMAGVFLAGIGAGIYFGQSSESASQTPATGDSQPTAALTADTTPDSALAEPSVPEASSAVPTVAPLVENAATQEPTGEEAAEVQEPAVEEAAAEVQEPAVEEAAAEVQESAVQESNAGVTDELDVQPLGESEASASEPEMVVRPLEITTTKDATNKALKRSDKKVTRKARSSDSNDLTSRAPRNSPTGDPGVLMLAAKPPCDILIDGKKTGLKTPQRVLRLPPGKHKVTLVNREHKLRDSFRVSIQSGKKTRVVRDMTSKIK